MGRLLTVKQAAEKLQVSPNTIRHWLKTGRIPGRKFGRVYRLVEGELDKPAAEPTNLVPPPPGMRKSAFGAFSHVPGSVDDFMRRKHEENEREERLWEERYRA